MTTFTNEELAELLDNSGEPATVERDGLTYRFQVVDDQHESVVDYVNGMDCLGRFGWPVSDRDTGRERRPDDFTGAARKLSGWLCDTIWWEPYRDDAKVYDSPTDVAFMRGLLDHGTVGVTVTVSRTCECCDQLIEIADESLWGIESPEIDDIGYDYVADVAQDLIHNATYNMEGAT